MASLGRLLSLLSGAAGRRIGRASGRCRIVRDVPYRSGSSDPKHRLDLYVPRANAAAASPVVVFVHGGFWSGQGRRYYQAFTGMYGNVGVALARRGIAVALPSYRLSPSVGIGEQLDDVTCALGWVEANSAAHGGDPRRIVLAGYSAGGHLVSLLGLDASGSSPARRLRGCVSVSGILDIPAMALEQDAAFNAEVTFPLFGKTAEAQRRLSPRALALDVAPPFLVLVAERDYRFVREAGRDVAAELASRGRRVSFVEVPGFDHADMMLRINAPGDRVTEPFATFVHDVTAAGG